LQVVQNVARIRDQLCALLDEPIRSHCARRVDVAGHSVNRATLFQRLCCCDKRAAVQSRFNHENAVAPTGNDPIAHWESLAIWFDLDRELGYDCAISRANFLSESGVFRRI
jgi:hypothetical protein